MGTAQCHEEGHSHYPYMESSSPAVTYTMCRDEWYFATPEEDRGYFSYGAVGFSYDNYDGVNHDTGHKFRAARHGCSIRYRTRAWDGHVLTDVYWVDCYDWDHSWKTVGECGYWGRDYANGWEQYDSWDQTQNTDYASACLCTWLLPPLSPPIPPSPPPPIGECPYVATGPPRAGINLSLIHI